MFIVFLERTQTKKGERERAPHKQTSKYMTKLFKGTDIRV